MQDVLETWLLTGGAAGRSVFLNGSRLGHGSFDAQAASLNGMFDFSKGKPRSAGKLLLDPETGLIQQGN